MLKILLKNKYKISISIIFGFLGFFVNFHTIIFPFGEYTAAILLGLLFPILITLSWGWKYGLLSALCGGCQTMWWLWGPSNGYAILFVAPPFTLWIIWHGIFAELRRKQKTHKWWMSMYIVEIPFRILNSINLLTLSRWAITLNPPSWNWASNAPNIIPMHFSVFVTIKQAAVGFVILLLVDVILNIKYVRYFLKLKEYIDHKKTGYIISLFLLLGCLFWLLDSFFYSFAFHKESSFLDLFALNIPDYNVFTRTVIFIFCLICGLITSRILHRQKKGEMALRESEIRYKNLFSMMRLMSDNLPDLIWVKDMEGKFVFVNKACSKILLDARDTDEPIGKTDIYFAQRGIDSHPEIPDYFTFGQMCTDSDLAVLNSKKPLRFDESGNVRGEFLFLDVYKAPFEGENGDIVGTVGSARVVTKERQMEKELKKYHDHLEELVKERTSQLEEANKELEAFSYSVSHDLRAPLRHIDGFSKLLNKNIRNVIDEKSQNYFDNIIDSSKQMNRLIDDLLIFSRLSRKDIKKIKINMKTAIDEAMLIFDSDIKENNISVTVDDMPEVIVDVSLMRQVWVNLISNAIKFTGNNENPEIHIGTDTDKDGNTIFFIKDNGVGFDQKYVNKIFDVFQRLHNINEFPGTGIGLANVKRIITKHGGNIRAEGKINEGASFFFTLSEA